MIGGYVKIALKKVVLVIVNILHIVTIQVLVIMLANTC